MDSRSASRAADAFVQAPARLGWVVAFFVLSGMTGLIYQSTWTQYLGLVLGSAAYAQSLVLAIFMGGMALGSWLASRYVERIANLLLGYGVIEGAVGLLAIGFHLLFLIGTRWLYDDLVPQLSNPDLVTAARWIFSALFILPQTVLLGMTFPIMSAGLMRWMPDRAGAILGGLYFLNSAGAAIGALLATFVLVPAVGLPGALAFAGILNLMILAGVLLARFPARMSANGAAKPQQAGPEVAAPMVAAELGAPTRLMLLAAALTGLSSFMYEIGWVRMLSLALGSSLHAFELMLAAFIGGLAWGALWVRRRLDGLTSPIRFVGWIQLLMGTAALATLPLYDSSFQWVGWIMATLARSDSGYLIYNFATGAVSIAIMVPAAFFAGMTLPSMTYVLLRSGARERVVGQIYSANTLGAIVGVFLMMHWAMPTLGLKYSMVLAALIDVVLGIAILLSIRPLPKWNLAVAAVIATVAVLAAVNLAEFDPRRMNAGVYRTAILEIAKDRQILFAADGKTASIAVHALPGKNATLSTNGKPDASMALSAGEPTGPDEPTMVLMATLGLAYNFAAKDVAVIGFGSGLTTHTFATVPTLASITSVEIEPMMVEAAKRFGARVERAYSDPRSHIVIDDARAYFSGQNAKYDIIASEPSNPWVSGVARLFSREFYQFVRRHLTEGGVFVQWVQAYEISDGTVMSLLRAIDASFADYALYLSNGGDILIVATTGSRLAAPSMAFMESPATAALADVAGVRSYSDLVERKLADRSVLHWVLDEDGGPANSDFMPVLAHWAPRDRFMQEKAELVLNLFDSPLGILTAAGHYPRNSDASWRTPPVRNPIVESRRLAEAVYAGLLGGVASNSADNDLTWHGIGLRLRELGRTCFRDESANVATALMLRAFQATAPFLDDNRLRALWSDAEWQSCTSGSGYPALDLLGVFDAVVRKDGAVLAERTDAFVALHENAVDADLAPFLSYASLYAAFLNRNPVASAAVVNRALHDPNLSPRGRFKLLATMRILQNQDAMSANIPASVVAN